MLFTDTGLEKERALRRRPRRHNENIIAVQGSDDGDADGGAAGGPAPDDALIQRQRSEAAGGRGGKYLDCSIMICQALLIS